MKMIIECNNENRIIVTNKIRSVYFGWMKLHPCVCSQADSPKKVHENLNKYYELLLITGKVK